MATLRKGTQSITVPAETVADYLKQGWQDVDGQQPQVAAKPKRSRRRSKPVKPAAAVVVEVAPVEPEDVD